MMKAVVKQKAGAGNLICTTRPVPEITPDEVLIEVKAAGICGTDISLYHWKEAVAKSYNISFPRILGHEFSGVIAKTGNKVDCLKPGDRVTVNPIIYCGKCRYCAEGVTCVCDDRPMLGAELDGAFAQYVAARAANVMRLPDSVTYECGAVVEPFCVAIHAVERVTPEYGDAAVVVGAGAISLLLLMVLKEGTSRVIITGLAADEERLALARSLGAETINVEKEDPVEKVKALTGGRGADVVYEAAGHPSAVQQAIRLARKRGRICLVGLPGKPAEILTTELAVTEKSLIATRATERKTWGKAFEILSAGRVDLSPVITHRLPLEEAEKGFKLVDERQGVRVLLIP